MSLLRNQIKFHQDCAHLLSTERNITPCDSNEGFAWYLCPAVLAEEQVWLLVNAEFGYVELLEQVVFSAEAIELAVLDVIKL